MIDGMQWNPWIWNLKWFLPIKSIICILPFMLQQTILSVECHRQWYNATGMRSSIQDHPCGTTCREFSQESFWMRITCRFPSETKRWLIIWIHLERKYNDIRFNGCHACWFRCKWEVHKRNMSIRNGGDCLIMRIYYLVSIIWMGTVALE